MTTYASILFNIPASANIKPALNASQPTYITAEEDPAFDHLDLGNEDKEHKSGNCAFLSLIQSGVPKDHGSITAIHRQLLSKPRSVSSLMGDEVSRQLFLLSFPEKARIILEFLAKIKTSAARFPSQELPLAEAFIQYLVLPLLNEEHRDLFGHVELIELISASFALFISCDGSPAEVRTLTSRLTEFGGVVERFVSHPSGKEVLEIMLSKDRYATSAFEQQTLKVWIEKLITLARKCAFPHEISGAVAKWKAISDLAAACSVGMRSAPSSPVTPKSPAFQPLTHMRRLSKDDKKSGQSVKEPLFSVSPEIANQFQYFGKASPKTVTAARNMVQDIERAEIYGVFHAILKSFPCATCYGSFISEMRITMAEPYDPSDGSVDAEIWEDGRETREDFGRSLGPWRIMFSKEAMKDLASAENSGRFESIKNRLRELAAGTWGRRRSLTQTQNRPGFPVPLFKAVYDNNGTIMWHVYVAYDEAVKTAKQVILVWRIGDHKEISRSISTIERNQKTYGKAFIEACTRRQVDPETNVCSPVTFENADVLKLEHVESKLTLEESVDLHNAIITGKFYTITQAVLDTLLVGGLEADFRFDVSEEENAIIRHSSSSSFVLGRSGTGKTTCLVFKLLARYISQRRRNDSVGIRQIFITRSSILADKLNTYIRRLIDCELGRFVPNHDFAGRAEKKEELVEEDDSKPAKELWTLQDNNFPLVCSFNSFMDILDKSIKVAERKDFSDLGITTQYTSPKTPNTPQSPRLRRNSLFRVPREVDFETFNKDYWRRFPSWLKRNSPVDLVFSEILGVIKGSTSCLTGLKPLTKEEYLKRSCRVAPLFTTHDEREAVYEIYEAYERIKGEYQDWDAIDRARSILLQLAEDPSLLNRLRNVIHELYVDEIQDQRLLEIELLFALVKSPRGIHLAGDSAQCISRDSTFRFNDIKSLFYDCFANLSLASSNPCLARPTVFKLAQNYRSHQGIVGLGALLVDSLYKGFPDLIDKLSPESGKYGGPKPTFFVGFRPEEVLLNQAFGLVNVQEHCSDFGAEQVVLVRDEETLVQVEAKLGSDILILTVLQSKGMEFDDVVLLNFFSSSPYQKDYRAWEQLIDERNGDFDAKKHSPLCSEFKNLYVAITRCRANLRIVEEAAEIAELIVGLWTKKVREALIEPVRPGDSNLADKLKELRTGSSGNAESWKRNAEYLMFKKLYKQALFCYVKAGHRQGQILAKAFIRRQEVEELSLAASRDRASIEVGYVESAILFEEADSPLRASECYEMIGKFKHAGDMWVRRGKPEKAAPLFEKGELWDLAVESYTNAGKFVEAARTLLSAKLYDELVDYLHDHERHLDRDFYKRTTRLCNLFQVQGKLKRCPKEKVELLLGSDSEREFFYRSRGLTDSLLEHLTSPSVNKISEAFDYLITIGEFERALTFKPVSVLIHEVPVRELRALIQCLLVRDLRTCGEAHPFFAERAEEGRMIIPDIDLLREALIRDLKTSLRIENSRIDLDMEIRGYPACRTYVSLAFLERIQERIESVSAWKDLPIQELHYLATILEGIVRDNKITEILEIYLGFYRTEGRDLQEYHVWKCSPLNVEGKNLVSIPGDAAVEQAQKWLGTLVMSAFYKTVDCAWDHWKMLRPSSHCVNYQIEGNCKRAKCNFYHGKMDEPAFQGLSEKIHEMCHLIRRLEFIYNTLRFVLDGDATEGYRRRQRKCFESLIDEVLTFVSAIYQSPVSPSPLFKGKHELVWSEYLVRAGVERIIWNQHLQGQWGSLRDNFSDLLEEVQRARSLGGRFSHMFMDRMREKVNEELRELRKLPYPPATTERGLALGCFLQSEKLGAFNFFHAEPSKFLRLFERLCLLATKYPSHFSSFHSVLSLFERIATYLMLMTSPEGFLVMRSWCSTHVRFAKPAATSRLCRGGHFTKKFIGTADPYYEPTYYDRQEHANCLVELVLSVIYILNKLLDAGRRAVPVHERSQAGEHSQEEKRTLFTSGRDRLIHLKRCLDLIFVSTVNLYCLEYNCGVRLQFFERVWPEVKRIMNANSSWAGIRLYAQHDYSIHDLIRPYIDSVLAYNGKETLAIFARNTTEMNSRFKSFPMISKLMNELLVEDRPPVSTAAPAVRFNSTQQQPQITDFADADEEPEAAGVIDDIQRGAAAVIVAWWRAQWPLVQNRRRFAKSELGRATALIYEVCKEIVADDKPNKCLKHRLILSGLGPEAYIAVSAALGVSNNVMSRFQFFFSTLSKREADFAPDKLAKIDMLSEKANKNKEEVEKMKLCITEAQRVVKMDVQQLEEMLLTLITQAEKAKEKFIEFLKRMEEIVGDESEKDHTLKD